MQDRRITLSQNALFQDIAGDGVILDLASASYFGLDGVGVRFWKLLQEDASFGRAYEALLAEYDVEAAVLEKDLDELVSQLAGAGLVTVESSCD